MPTLPAMTATLAQTTGHWAQAGFPLTQRADLFRRDAQCERCPAYQTIALGMGRCRACGCLSVKRRMATATCPLDLWGESEPLKSGLLRYDCRDALKEHYAGVTPNPAYTPASPLAWQLALSGLSRPASRMGLRLTGDAEMEGVNPLDDYAGTADITPRIPATLPGRGHVIQRLSVANGLFPDSKPRGCVVCVRDKVRKLAALSASGQALAVIEPTLAIMGLEAVRVPVGFTEAVECLATAQWFIGEPGEAMHLAAALGVRSIILTPGPVWLPVLVPCADGSEWLYPQNTHLALEGETLLTPRFTAGNLTLALKEHVYPFGSDAYLGLIQD